MPSDPTRPGAPRYTPVQRRLLTATAGLVVAALAGGAYVLTYDLLRDLAIEGRASRRWAPIYPAMADALTALTILSLVITRNARWWTRLLRWALLLALVAGVAAISVQHSLRGFDDLSGDPLRVGVAVAPHAILVIALWLWLTMFKQIRTAHPATGEPEPVEGQRGHVKVIEPAPVPEARPELEASPEPEARPELETRPELEAPPGLRAPAEPETPPEPDPAPEVDHIPGLGPLAIGPPATLPTDVELVRDPAKPPAQEPRSTRTTRPDLVMPGTHAADGEEHDGPPADRAEDPDAADDRDTRRAAGPAADSDGEESDDLPILTWNPPPSGSFRSSPVPPAE
ncbi:DUF2637 domain-containing protein [Actinomadura litoris]|uniref:DUF2637 domain-containing protein n=1 Tax=Actinomadura litoris TaxID=2678616 RepID=UPI001FA6C8B8|nr:DUF2637 domain-containing protein [Actinomadura litoris]